MLDFLTVGMLYAERLVNNRRNKQTRKHKTWDGDAVLLVKGARAELLDMEGQRYAFLSCV
jgi:hypothetical protein